MFLGNNIEAACKRTWDELENKLKSKISLWRMRALSLKDRSKMVNTLLLTKLNNVLMTHHLPNNTLNIKSKITNFIWRAKSNQIAHRTIISKYQEGGLNLIDISAKKETFRMKII